MRRWFDEQSKGFFTLSEGERKYVQNSVQPSKQTPIEFFRSGGGGKEEKKLWDSLDRFEV